MTCSFITVKLQTQSHIHRDKRIPMSKNRDTLSNKGCLSGQNLNYGEPQSAPKTIGTVLGTVFVVILHIGEENPFNIPSVSLTEVHVILSCAVLSILS